MGKIDFICVFRAKHHLKSNKVSNKMNFTGLPQIQNDSENIRAYSQASRNYASVALKGNSSQPTTEPSTDFQDIKRLNPYNKKEYIGNRAYLEYASENGITQSITGTVVANLDAGAGLYIQSDKDHQVIPIEQEYSGRIKTSAGEVKTLKLKPPEEDWELIAGIDRWSKSSYKEQVHKLLGQDETGCVLKTEIEKEPIVIAGKASIVEQVPGYQVLRISDSNQNRHLIDLDYVDSNSTSIAKVEEEPPVTSTKLQPVQLISKTYKKRADIVDRVLDDVEKRKISPFDNKDFYGYLAEDLESTRKLLRKLYPNESDQLISTITQVLPENNIILLADPGIASRLPEMIDFVRQGKIDTSKISPFELRQKFSEHLGTQKIYRGMVITDNQAQNMVQNGILAPALLDKKTARAKMIDLLDPDEKISTKPKAKSYRDEIIQRVSTNCKENLFMSVTSYPDIAVSLGNNYGQRNDGSEKLYIFDVDMPKISVLKGGEGMFDVTARYDLKCLKVGNNSFDMKNDLTGIESFVPCFIPNDKFNCTEATPKALMGIDDRGNLLQ